MQVRRNGLGNNLDNETTFNEGMYEPCEIQVKSAFSIPLSLFLRKNALNCFSVLKGIDA